MVRVAALVGGGQLMRRGGLVFLLPAQWAAFEAAGWDMSPFVLIKTKIPIRPRPTEESF